MVSPQLWRVPGLSLDAQVGSLQLQVAPGSRSNTQVNRLQLLRAPSSSSDRGSTAAGSTWVKLRCSGCGVGVYSSGKRTPHDIKKLKFRNFLWIDFSFNPNFLGSLATYILHYILTSFPLVRCLRQESFHYFQWFLFCFGFYHSSSRHHFQFKYRLFQ